MLCYTIITHLSCEFKNLRDKTPLIFSYKSLFLLRTSFFDDVINNDNKNNDGDQY